MEYKIGEIFKDEFTHEWIQCAVPIVKPISKDNRCHIQSDNLVSIELNDNANRYCGDICGDNRFEIIEKAKLHLIDSTNIMDSQKEMEVLDSFLFRCWQMGWLKKYE